MKKIRTLYLALLLLSAGVCRAQTDNVYQHGAQFTFDGITFTVDRTWTTFMTLTLYRNNNWLDEKQWYYADSGLPLATDDEYAVVRYRINDKYGHIRAMQEIFTEEEIAALSTEKYAPLTLYCAFDTEGELQEVSFLIDLLEPLMQVSPDRYARLIKLLKERLKLIYEPDSLKVQFVTLRVFVRFDNWDKIPPERPADLEHPKQPDNPTPPRPGE